MIVRCNYSELLPINSPKLIANPKNNNRHSADQIERLAKIINFQGQRVPIRISNLSGKISKGHATLEAIRLLNWSHVAVEYQDYDSLSQEYADLTADNEIARWSELDRFQLFEDLKEIELGDFELFGIENDIFRNLAESDLDISNVDDVDTIYNFAIKCDSKIELEKLKAFFKTNKDKIQFSTIEHLMI